MTGDLYLLNALWIGAALCITGALLPRIFTVLRIIVVMCLPFGIVAAWHTVQDIRDAVRKAKEPVAPDNVTPISKRKPKR